MSQRNIKVISATEMSQESYMRRCGLVGESVLRVEVWDGERPTLNKVCFKVEAGLTDLHLRLREKPEEERTMSQCWWTRTTLSSTFEELVWCLLFFLDELQNFKLVQNSWMPQDKLRFMMSLTLNVDWSAWMGNSNVTMLQRYNQTTYSIQLYRLIINASFIL